MWYISNGLQKKIFIEKNRFFSVDYVNIKRITYYTYMTSNAIWVDEITGVVISIKKVNTNLNILKK